MLNVDAKPATKSMRPLTHAVKLEIIDHFHAEMTGLQDKSWRDRYAEFFLPESAGAQLSLASAVPTTESSPGRNKHSLDIELQQLPSTSCSSIASLREPAKLRTDVPMTMKEFEMQVMVGGKLEDWRWSEFSIRCRGITIFTILFIFACIAIIIAFSVNDSGVQSDSVAGLE